MKNRDSNVVLESLNLLEHWRYNAAVLMKDENSVIENCIEVYLTSESLDKRLERVDKSKYKYFQSPIIKTVDSVLHHDVEGLKINGLAGKELYITKEDLLPIKDEVDTIIVMLAVLDKGIDKTKAFELLYRKTFYIIGNLPTISDMKVRSTFGYETIDRDLHHSVKLFLTEEHAQKYNHNKCPINAYYFWNLAHFFQNSYGLIIEPHENYWLEYNPKELEKELEKARANS